MFQTTLPSLALRQTRCASGSGEIEPAFVHGDAAVADMEALVFRIDVMPELMSGAGIDGPDVVGDGEIQDAIDQQGRGFDGAALIGLENPGERELTDIFGSDLGELAMALAGIVAVVGRPGIGGRMEEETRVEALGIDAAAADRASTGSRRKRFFIAGFASRPSDCGCRSRNTWRADRRGLGADNWSALGPGWRARSDTSRKRRAGRR